MIAVDVLFWALDLVRGVGRLFAFCDDWEIELLHLRFLGAAQGVVEAFERASGQVINQSKSKILLTRPTADGVRTAIGNRWPRIDLQAAPHEAKPVFLSKRTAH